MRNKGTCKKPGTYKKRHRKIAQIMKLIKLYNYQFVVNNNYT